MEIIKALIENKANVNHVNRYGNTPLMETTRNGNLSIVNLLVHNADVNQYGNTALMSAVQKGNLEIVKAFKEVLIYQEYEKIWIKI